MILELSFNNYKMFKGDNTLSFSADTRIKQLGSNYININERNVLKSISLYGQNNIGKSNIIFLFRFIQLYMQGVENIPFNSKLFNDTDICDISIIFNTNEDKNWKQYKFSYDSVKNEIVSESLSELKFYKTGNSIVNNVYTRDNKKHYLSIFDTEIEKIPDLLPSKKPFLYCVSLDNGEFSNLKPYLKSFQDFANSLDVIELFNIPIEKTLNILKGKDKKKQEFVRQFVKNADLSIDNFFYNDKAISKNDEEKIINEQVLNRINLIDQLKLFTTYKGKSVPSILFDSSGTKKIEALAAYVYDAIIEGKTLIVDELDNGLHYKLSRAILSAFNSFENEKGQLLFTAYDIELISCKYMMRKDQIYFCFKNDNFSSKLFCLKDAPVSEGGPRSAEDMIKHYNRGDFGYVPSPNFLKYLSTHSEDK